MPKAVNIAAEDNLSEAIIRSLLANASRQLKVANSYPIKKGWQDDVGKGGYGYIKKSLVAFNAAAAHTPFVVLIDADDRPCPPQTIAEWLEGKLQHSDLICRVAIREAEAWLLADRSGLSEYLSIPERWIPLDTARIKDPKRYIVRMAARSSRKEIRADLAPPKGSKGKTGPYYTQSLSSFAKGLWQINEASKHSESLRRAKAAIDALSRRL